MSVKALFGSKKHIKKINTPSPTCYKVLNQNHLSRKFLYSTFLERMSLFISQIRNRVVKGSMTIEACFVLPIFLLFFLQLISSLQILHLHGQMTFALWNTGHSLGVYAGMSDKAEVNILDRAATYLYIQDSVRDLLGERYLESAPFERRRTGIYYSEATYKMEEECIDLIATYQISPQVELFPIGYKRLCNHYYGRAWTGYDITSQNTEERYVYVTEYGEVWHATIECTYLDIEVEEVEYAKVESIVNQDGEKYTCCSVCKEEGLTEKVYVAKTGKRYHLTKKCSSLRRNIRVIEWDERRSYRPCSKCIQSKEE